MADTSTVLARLRAPNAAETLAVLLVDHALERPLSDLVPAAALGPAFAEGLAASLAAPGHRDWVRDQLERALGDAESRKGSLRDHLAPTVVEPLKNLVRRPYTPDPAVVRSLADHPVVRKMLREVLQDTLMEFARRLGSMGKSLPGVGRLSGLMDVAKGVATAVTGEVERHLEGRVTAFVDEAVGRVIELSVAQVTSEKRARELGRWRADLVDAALDEPISRYVAAARRVDLDQAVDDAVGMLEALTRWDALGARVTAEIERALEASEASTLRAWLAGSGLEAAWRPHLEARLAEELGALFESEGFARWLSETLDG